MTTLPEHLRLRLTVVRYDNHMRLETDEGFIVAEYDKVAKTIAFGRHHFQREDLSQLQHFVMMAVAASGVHDED